MQQRLDKPIFIKSQPSQSERIILPATNELAPEIRRSIILDCATELLSKHPENLKSLLMEDKFIDEVRESVKRQIKIYGITVTSGQSENIIEKILGVLNTYANRDSSPREIVPNKEDELPTSTKTAYKPESVTTRPVSVYTKTQAPQIESKPTIKETGLTEFLNLKLEAIKGSVLNFVDQSFYLLTYPFRVLFRPAVAAVSMMFVTGGLEVKDRIPWADSLIQTASSINSDIQVKARKTLVNAESVMNEATDALKKQLTDLLNRINGDISDFKEESKLVPSAKGESDLPVTIEDIDKLKQRIGGTFSKLEFYFKQDISNVAKNNIKNTLYLKAVQRLQSNEFLKGHRTVSWFSKAEMEKKNGENSRSRETKVRAFIEAYDELRLTLVELEIILRNIEEILGEKSKQ